MLERVAVRMVRRELVSAARAELGAGADDAQLCKAAAMLGRSALCELPAGTAQLLLARAVDDLEHAGA